MFSRVALGLLAPQAVVRPRLDDEHGHGLAQEPPHAPPGAGRGLPAHAGVDHAVAQAGRVDLLLHEGGVRLRGVEAEAGGQARPDEEDDRPVVGGRDRGRARARGGARPPSDRRRGTPRARGRPAGRAPRGARRLPIRCYEGAGSSSCPSCAASRSPGATCRAGARSPSLEISRSTSSPAASWPSPAPRAAARARCSACWPASTGRPAAAWSSTATTSPRSPRTSGPACGRRRWASSSSPSTSSRP